MNKFNWALSALIVVHLGGCSSQNKQTSASSGASTSEKPVAFGHFDYSRADRDRSGYIDLAEAQDQAGAAFEAADKDKNKMLSGDEMGRLSGLDLDKNGSITIFEALDATEKQFNEADQKKRGILDARQSTQLSIAK